MYKVMKEDFTDFIEVSGLLNYDPETISKIYKKNPQRLLKRLWQTLIPIFAYIFSVGWDKLTGRLKNKTQARFRARELTNLLVELGPAFVKAGQALSTSSLDAPVNGDDGRSFLGDLIADSNNEEPLDQVEQKMHQEQLGKWLSHLSEQEQHVLKLRFGLDGNERHTLAEIGRLLEVSRERVRQVELKAFRKLRNLTRKLPSGI